MRKLHALLLLASLAVVVGVTVGCIALYGITGRATKDTEQVALIRPTPSSFDRMESRFPCTIVGTQDDDRLAGSAGRDVVCGLAGDDLIHALAGNDVLYGGAGDDDLRAGAGKDILHGGPGSDRLTTRDRRPYDLLAGEAGTDLCVGDPGDLRSTCRHPLAPSHRRTVPVLMYHVVGDPPAGAPHPELFVSAGALAKEMRYLDRHGYEVVSLQDVYDYWHGGSLPSKPVVVSFDDGFSTDATEARPILSAHGWAGTLNLALSHYGRSSWQLNEREVKQLIAANWEVDSHSRTHPFLPGLSGETMAEEVAGSRRFLRRMFHVPVNFFAYPSGAYDDRVIAAVRKAGYSGACATLWGRARRDEPYRLRRIAILRSDGVAGLAVKLASPT